MSYKVLQMAHLWYLWFLRCKMCQNCQNMGLRWAEILISLMLAEYSNRTPKTSYNVSINYVNSIVHLNSYRFLKLLQPFSKINNKKNPTQIKLTSNLYNNISLPWAIEHAEILKFHRIKGMDICESCVTILLCMEIWSDRRTR